jgi:hypothetical protein
MNNRTRQIHLDFHTSPFINDVAKDFDPIAFAKQMKAAYVNSVTVFAKCHHGMCYYPSKSGIQHPALNGRDMLGEMIDALHNEGIRAPIYTTVAWEENVAQQFPQWRQMKKEGTFANVETSADGITKQPAGWKFNDWVNPEYQDYIEQHLIEIVSNYEVDGLFLDILFFHPEGGWSDACRDFRAKHGLLEDTKENHIRFESLAQESFTKRFTALIQSKVPEASIFYNTPNNLYINRNEGAMRKAAFQTHFEIESLPSGFWGYYHFPRLARRLAREGKFWLGMTGKFQKMWGDFGGLKPHAALEFECFRSQALGGGNSVGDQLHPRGILDEETYRMIGNVYAQVEHAEAFYQGSEALPQIGILCPNYPGLNEDESSKSEEGVVLMLEELHYDCAIIDEESDLLKFELIILPDSVVVSDKLKKSIKNYLQNNGKIISTGKSGFDRSGNWNLPVLPATPEGETELFPNYWSVSMKLAEEGMKGERVVYQQGMNFRPAANCEIFVNRILPYFKRTDLKYCSHFQTPPDKIDNNYPAVFGNEKVIVFADPVFKEYRQSGNVFIRKVVGAILQKMIGKSPFGSGLSSRVLCVPRRRKDDLIITLLNYIPVRKALDIDVIEEATSFAGKRISFVKDISTLKCVNNGEIFRPDEAGNFWLPPFEGRILLEVTDFFKF